MGIHRNFVPEQYFVPDEERAQTSPVGTTPAQGGSAVPQASTSEVLRQISLKDPFPQNLMPKIHKKKVNVSLVLFRPFANSVYLKSFQYKVKPAYFTTNRVLLTLCGYMMEFSLQNLLQF